MKSRKAVVGTVVAAVSVALFATACFTANLGGSASSPSPIQYGGFTGPVGATGATGASGSVKKIEFSLKSLDSLGTGLGGGSGFLRDNGTNPAFPYGVKISFANSLVLGIGGDCTDNIDGPSRAAHSGAQSRGATTGPTGPTDCELYSDPRLWFGLVTYSSANPSRYPNQGFAPCNSQYQEWISGFPVGFNAPSLRGPVSVKAGSSKGQPISGFGAAMIYDTNYSGNYDKGDRFGFVSICGPYTHIDGTELFGDTAPVTPNIPDYRYNYGTCSNAVPNAPGVNAYLGGPFGGMVPSFLVDEIEAPGDLAGLLVNACNVRSSGGDLKIGIATRITTGEN